MALRGIGPLLLLLILLTLDRAALFGALGGAQPLPLLAAYAVPLPAIALRALRWRLLLGARAGRWSFGELLALYAQSIAAGVLTPGRLGELAKGALVARRGVGLGAGLWSALLDRLADLGFLALLAAGAGALYLAPGSGDAAILWAVAAGAVTGTLGLVTLAGPAGQRWRRGLLRVLGRPEASDDPVAPGLTVAGACAGLTVASWAVTYLANYLYCAALGLEIGYLEIAGISAVASLVASLPISVAGAGTRDAALIALLAPYTVAASQAVALSVLMLSNVLFVGAVCALAFLATPLDEGS